MLQRALPLVESNCQTGFVWQLESHLLSVLQRYGIATPLPGSSGTHSAYHLLYSGDSQTTAGAIIHALQAIGLLAVRVAPHGADVEMVFTALSETTPLFVTVLLSRRALSEGEWASVPRENAPGEGLCIVMLGPDGVGKSSVSRRLGEMLAPLYPNVQRYHYRPRIIGRIGPGRPIHQPHSLAPRGRLASLAYLGTVFVDCWLGYLLSFRRLLKRRTLIVFDRYFHDVLTDPIRYRYGGPQWIPRILNALIPPRDLTFVVLDAEENLIVSRKAELPVDEVRRQRKLFAEWAATRPDQAIRIETPDDIESAAVLVCNAILHKLASRLISVRRRPVN